MKKETILKILIFLLLFISFIYKGGAFYLSKLLISFILSVSLFLLTLKTKCFRKPFPIFGASILLFNFIFIMSLFQSICKTNTIQYIVWFTLYSIFFFYIYENNENIFDYSIKLTIFLISILSIYGLLQYFGIISKYYWGNKDFLSSTFVNHTHFANLIVMITPIFIAYALFNNKSTLNKATNLILTIIFLTSFILAQSRIAFFSLIISNILFLFLSYASSSYYKNKILLTTIIILLTIVPILLSSKKFKRFNAKTIKKDKSYKVRKEIFTATIKMIKLQKHPTGAGNFSYGFQKFKSSKLYQFRIHYAYNEILQLIAENGFIILIPIIFFLYTFFRSKLKTLKNNYPITSIYHNALFSSIFGNIIHSFFDLNFHIPANFTLFTIILGLYAGKTAKLWKQ